MESSWTDFLSFINLEPEFRFKSRLEICLKNQLESPGESFIDMLVEQIKETYKAEDSFQIVWFKRSIENPDISKLIAKHLKFSDRKIIKNLWGRFAGEYFLFLPNSFDIHSIPIGDEEETIGLILSQLGLLLMKTPDGHEILYLSIVQ